MADRDQDHDQGGVGSGEEVVEEEVEVEGNGALKPSLPMGRVKKIMKQDQEIKKVNSEALLLISLSTDLFLASLAARSRDAALRNKRRVIKLEHIRSAVRDHQPTSDFLLDCLPRPTPPPPRPSASGAASKATSDKPLPKGTRRIDDFLRRSSDAPQGS